MFGYVRPLRDELKLRDYDRFRALYCGLCHTVGARCGQIPRFFLNYDFTFLALLLSAAEPEGDDTLRRCFACPLRRRRCARTTEALALAADESVVLLYWKARDSVLDEEFFRGLPARLLLLLLAPSYRRAKRARPDFDACARARLEELRALELANSPSLDRTADAFARILSAAARTLREESLARPMEQLLYHVGRWIYLADAYHDRWRDRKRGSYNPLLTRFSGAPALSEEELAELTTTMTHSLHLAYAAYSLIDFGTRAELVGNILYLGMPAAQRLVLADQWKLPRSPLGFFSKETEVTE